MQMLKEYPGSGISSCLLQNLLMKRKVVDGVERALQMVQQAVKDAHAPARARLVPLIHNPYTCPLKTRGVLLILASAAGRSVALVVAHPWYM